MMPKPLGTQWESAADQAGWARPGTLGLLIVMTISWLCWSIGSTVAAAIWIAFQREQKGSTWPLGDSQ